MESVSIKSVHGMAKVVGSAVSVSGALVFAFAKGPPLKFMMNWYTSSHRDEDSHQLHYKFNSSDHHSLSQTYHKGDWIKGSLLMLSANTAWSLWLILQVQLLSSLAHPHTHTYIYAFASTWHIEIGNNNMILERRNTKKLSYLNYCYTLII